MTVENTTNKQAAQVMGSATYDFTFRCLAKDPTETAAKEAIKCIVADSDVNETTLVYGTDYSVSLDADGIGGTVTVVNSRDSTYTITIMREYQLKQDIVLNDFDEFAAKTLEGSLDKLTMIEQQNQEQLTRSVKVGVTSSVDPDELVQQVERIYTSIDNVDTVADDISNVNDVAESIANVNTLVNNLTNVDTVAESIANVNVVSNNISNVNTCSTNMTAIQEAPAAATAASTSATNAGESATSAANSAGIATNAATSAQQYAQDTKGFAPIGSLLPLNCTADYIPDGCLPCDGYEYSQSQFPTLWTNYLTSSPVKLQTCTYAEYASDITTYGQCGKFAIDTVNETFKVPTRPNKAYIGVNSTAPVIGNGTAIGITDGTNTAGLFMNSGGNISNRFDLYGTNIGTSDTGTAYMAQQKTIGITTDPTKSGMIADTSDLIKESTDIRWFVVVANAQINQSQMDWSAWASSLAGKANTDMDNITATGKETVVGWGMPDYNAGVTISSGYTTTKKGVIYCTGYYGGRGGSGGEGYCWCKVGNSPQFLVAGSINATEGKPRSSLFIDINVGEACTFGMVNEGNASGSVSATFYPLKGA